MPSVIATHRVLSVMRLAGRKLGLGPQVLRTLELLLSCLPPQRNHHMVFASNETLCLRAGGLHERSLRRHIAALISAGLLLRNDSPNGKRYSRFNPSAATTIRFGLDLSPLFQRFEELAIIAQRAEEEARSLAYIKRKLRVLAQRLLNADPECEVAKKAALAARRTLSFEELEAVLAGLPEVPQIPAEAVSETSISTELSGIAGQNDRHQSNINKELIDKEKIGQAVLNTPLEAKSYAFEQLKSSEEIVHLAETLAPMLGIRPNTFAQAVSTAGSWAVSSAIWLIVEMGSKVRQPAAYFHSIFLGECGSSHQPWQWLVRRAFLSADKSATHPSCPRTICI